MSFNGQRGALLDVITLSLQCENHLRVCEKILRKQMKMKPHQLQIGVNEQIKASSYKDNLTSDKTHPKEVPVSSKPGLLLP